VTIRNRKIKLDSGKRKFLFVIWISCVHKDMEKKLKIDQAYE
jgi:hypothetical protein